MSDREIAEQLADPHRSVAAIAAALADAAIKLEPPCDSVPNMRVLVDKLTDHDMTIDAVSIPPVMVALCAIFAAKTNTAPKQIWEQFWKDAPTDAWWNERVGFTRTIETDDQEEDEDDG